MEDFKYAQAYNVGKAMPYFFLLSSFFDFLLVPYKLLNQRNPLKNKKPVIKQFAWYSQNFSFLKTIFDIVFHMFKCMNRPSTKKKYSLDKTT